MILSNIAHLPTSWNNQCDCATEVFVLGGCSNRFTGQQLMTVQLSNYWPECLGEGGTKKTHMANDTPILCHFVGKNYAVSNKYRQNVFNEASYLYWYTI